MFNPQVYTLILKQRSEITISRKNRKMYLRRGYRVPQFKSNNCLYAIYLTSVVSMMIGQVLCSDSDTNHIKKVPISGSGGGSIQAGSGGSSNFQKRSSYAVISQAMQETISNNEFGSEY